MMLGERLASTARMLATCAALFSFPACAPAEARPAGTVVYASGADLESANPLVTIHKYPEADHAFARRGGKTYRKAEADRALALTVEFFNKYLI